MVRARQNLPWVFWLWLGMTSIMSQVRAADLVPVVVVLQTAQNDAAKERERRFTEELGLALDGFVVRAEVAAPSFTAAPFSEQLALVRRAGANSKVAATLWLGETDSLVLLHLVALQTQRALVRIIEAVQRPDLESELALLAKELLGEAYLFARDSQVPEPIAAAVDGVRQSTTRTRPPRLEIGAFGEGATGVTGGVGPSSQAGGGIHVGVRTWREGFLSASGHAMAGPSGETRVADVRGAELGASLAASFRFALGALEIGPLLRGSVTQRRIDARTDSGRERHLRTLSARLAVGAEASLPIAASTRLWLEWTLGGRLSKTALRARSDGSTLVRTPSTDTALRLGLSVQFR